MPFNLSNLLNTVLDSIPNVREGLPEDVFYFVSQLTPLINVDLLIKNDAGQTLLTWRHDQYYGPAWHVPGGIIRFKEKIEDRIVKVANSELGAKVLYQTIPLHVRELMNSTRDVRGHFISMVYLCKLTSEPDIRKKFSGGEPSHGQWAWHDRAPENLLTQHEFLRPIINDTAPL